MKRIFISDLHLGKKDSKYKDFLKLLSYDKYDELYLVGDIFDLWVEDFSYIRKTCCDFFVTLEYQMSQGLKVIYIVGNHDSDIDVDGDSLFNKMDVSIAVKVGDMRLFHGHQYDYLMKKYFLLIRFCTWFISLFNSSYQVSLASKNKKPVFKKLLDDIKQHAVDDNSDAKTIMMGHTHIPEDIMVKGIRYVNLGDWVTHSTYAVETDGKLELRGLK